MPHRRNSEPRGFWNRWRRQILVIFIIRTNGRPWQNLPEPVLAASSLVALAVAMTLPFTPIGDWFGFVAPPPVMLAAIGLLVVVYLVCAELLKPEAIRLRHRRRWTGPSSLDASQDVMPAAHRYCTQNRPAPRWPLLIVVGVVAIMRPRRASGSVAVGASSQAIVC